MPIIFEGTEAAPGDAETRYITVSEADAYVSANILNKVSWDTADDAQKTIALTKATKAINRLPFRGEKVDPTQENEFPRGTDTEVPQDILDACAELAFSFIEGRDSEFEFDNLIILGRSFGSVSTTSKPDSSRAHIAAGIPSFGAWKLLLPYLRSQDEMLVQRV